MWLLNTTTYQLNFVQDPSQVAYAILSHVWDLAGEQTFQDVQSIHAAARGSFQTVPADDDPELLDLIRSRLSAKIKCCCDYARAKDIPYAWIDACCIDKMSSAELSEAINSMYDWYSHAEVCYVFLADVSDAESPHAPDSRFRWSAWFTRGWTLQELIVPWGSVFLSKEWRMLGTKASLAGAIEAVTGIERDVLLHVRPLHTVSVARRKSWASQRRTTRVEDEAYCLMGIFGVRLPVIYGEGTQAFVRLQEEIMRRIPDQSLFSWGLMLPVDTTTPDRPLPALRRVPVDELRASKGAYLLASCPGDFQHSARFSPIPLDALFAKLGLTSSAPAICFPTSHGIQTTLPVLTVHFPSKDGPVEVQLAMLACEDSAGRLPALFVSSTGASWTHFASGYDGENGFMTSSDGIVVLLPSGARLEFSPRLEMRGISRSEWIRAARATAFPYSKQYPRIALLDPSAFENNLVSAALPVSVRSLCIPYQRLQAGSGLAIYGRRPAWMGKGFAGDCEIVLPSWTLQHFRKLGVTLDGLGIKKNGTRSKAARLSYRVRHHTITLLHHATQGTVSITVFTCPAETRGPLHVSVEWAEPSHSLTEKPLKGSCQELPQVGTGIPTECDGHHINAWEDGKKRHHGPAEDSPAVTLQFSVWDADDLSGVGMGSDFCGYYALDIGLEFSNTASDSSSSRSSWCSLSSSSSRDLSDVEFQ